ncbi:retrovirus-related pol polyprotein from transposon TNT 1-94 [Tanacetum coccineum]
MWNDLILAHKGPSDTRDTKIAALRLKVNAFKSLEGEKVMGTFTRLKCLLNDLENNGVTIPQAEVNATFVNSMLRKWLSMNQTQRANNSIKTTIWLHYMESIIMRKDSDSDVEEDQRTNNEFMADLNAEYHERALLANQKRFYKRSRRVGSARKPIDKTKETCFTCGKTRHFQKDRPSNKTSTPSYPSSNNSFNKFKTYTPPNNQTSSLNTSNYKKDYKGKYKGHKAEMAVLTQRINDLTKGKSEKGKSDKGKSEKGLIAESFVWDEEFVFSEDEGTTKIRAFMTIAEDEPFVEKADARSSQWVDITMRKTCCKVTLDQLLSEQIPGNIVKALGGKGRRKKNNPSKEVLFTKVDVSTSESAPMITFDSEDDSNIQEPLPPLPKLTRTDPSGASKKVKGIKKQILIPSDTSSSVSQAFSSKTPKQKDYLKRTVWYLDSGCSRHMTEVKQYLHRYSKEPGPKVVFGDDSSRDTKGYGLVNCNGITFTRVAYVNGLKHNLISISQCDANFKVLFTKTQGTIFNQNDEVVLIAPRRRDVYIIDMYSFNKEINAYFLAKASSRVNWLWYKRLSHLNFKNINNLAKHNLVSGLPSLTFSKDKKCSTCEKGKHYRASFKTKRSFSINKSLHLLHMDLFGPVKTQTINHNKYTLIIVDEYSRYTWVFCLKKKSDAAECIISFIRKMENLNEVRVNELRSDNGIEFRNHKLEEFCDEKGISQNFSSPCTPEQNGVAERRNRTLIEAAKTIALDISNLHVFGCPVHIHNHMDHLGKFNEKANNGFFLGYSLVAKAFRVFNIRRQEIEETVHVTFSKDDEAISQTSTKGDAINFNENRTLSLLKNHLNNVLSESISDDQLASIISPSAEVIFQNPATQDRWSRDKHIELVNIIGEPLAGITTRSRIRDSDAALAHECLYVNFLSKIEPKKLIEALEEEGWVVAMQEELNQFERNKV